VGPCQTLKYLVFLLFAEWLPLRLGFRDMMANARNIPKLNYSSILLTMIFSMGEPMPITHHELLGGNFLSFLLNNVEYPPDTDIDEQIPDLFLNCIISFNLQFQDSSDNPVLNALEERDVAKTFTEKILLLLNREREYRRVEVRRETTTMGLQTIPSGSSSTSRSPRTRSSSSSWIC
jgi:hypothetical protein